MKSLPAHNSKGAISSKKNITVFTAIFLFVFFRMGLSYPIHLVFPSTLYRYVELYGGGEQYTIQAFFLTIGILIILIILYKYGSLKSYATEFQVRHLERRSQKHYVKIWFWLGAVIMLNAGILFWQSGFTLPLLQGISLDRTSYLILRSEYSGLLNMSLANINLHLLATTHLFVSFICIRRAIGYRLASIVIFLIASSFSLARGFILSGFLILAFSYLAYQPFSAKLTKKGVKIALWVFFMLFLSYALILYSTKESFSFALSILFDRLLHGQWLGMPLYLYFFQDSHASSLTLLHPLIANILGVTMPSTPGREMMMYINPAGVEAGSAGNVPTFFVGEAYALWGWYGVFASVVYVYLFLHFSGFVFHRMKKTYLSCCLYGWVAYKVSSGLMVGVSAFLIAGLPAIILTLFLITILLNRYRVSFRRSFQRYPSSAGFSN